MFAKMKHIFVLLGLLLACWAMQRCANMVAPVGGPKDTQAPMVVKAVPENHTLNFVNTKIELTFDEYVTLENAKQNVLISPPLDEKADIKLKDKTLVIKLKGALKPNTTYTINFGEAIKDLHEGNLFKDYVYTFSTGATLDTFCIGGKLLSITDMKPVEKAYVTLYDGSKEGLDTLPLTTKPDYIAKTDKEGKFFFTGLPDKSFLVFALNDANSNLYFDLPNEEVAFLDTLVAAVPFALPKKTVKDSLAAALPDTTLKRLADSGHPADTANKMMADTTLKIGADTLVKHLADTLPERVFDMKAKDLTLYMFTEEDTTQRLVEKKLVEDGLLRFVFRRPAQNVRIETPEMLPDSFHLVKVPSAAFDTISWYFTPKTKDSLWVHIQCDTLINDSLHFSLLFKDKDTKGKKGKKNPEFLKVTNNIVNGCLMPETVLTLTFSEPLLDFTLSDSTIFTVDSDTLKVLPEFEQADDFGFKYRMKTAVEAGKEYGISIPDSVFYGLRNRTNEAINLKFKKAADNDYGNIFITVQPPKRVPQVVVQLLDAKKKVVSEQIVSEKREVEFWYLPPGKYTLKAILDADANGKWSTGNYHRHFLPETIVDYKDELDLKAGWDIDLDAVWEIK